MLSSIRRWAPTQAALVFVAFDFARAGVFEMHDLAAAGALDHNPMHAPIVTEGLIGECGIESMHVVRAIAHQ